MTARAETVTILFTDLVSSTELLQRTGDEAAQRIFKTHHRFLSNAVQAHGGHEVKWLGDGLMVAFASAADAVRCAIAMQQSARRPAAGERLEIRVGLHIGEIIRDESDFFGTAVVTARRLCDAAGAGQIYVSDLVERLLAGGTEFRFDNVGGFNLKGLSEPVSARQVLYEHDPIAMLSRTPFVGRHAELKALHRALDAAIRGRVTFMMLAGEPGIGKTRLSEEFTDLARATGAVVLSGHCHEGEWAPPLSPFAEALQHYSTSVPADALRADLGFDAVPLARMVPAVRERLPELAEQAQADTSGDRARLLDGVASWLRRIASRAPVVLLLEDLHWCDDGTAALLRHLGHTVRDARLLVLGTFRDLEVGDGHVLNDALSDLRRNARLERVEMAGLTFADVASLLDATSHESVAPDVVHALAARTDGNPLFIREVLLHLAEQRNQESTESAWISVLESRDSGLPAGVRDVIKHRIGRLGEDAREMLLALCPMTGGFELPVLIALTGYEEARALDAIDEAIGARLIVERGRGASLTYDFHHALIRDALYIPLTASRRAALHRHVANAIERACAGRVADYADELAQHCDQGGLARKAVEYLLLSADRARGAYLNSEALTRYERAAALLASIATVTGHEEWRESVAARLHEGIADVLLIGGSYDDGQAHLRKALGAAPSAIAAARLWRKLAASLVIQRRYQEGAAAFDEARTSLELAPPARDAAWWLEWIQVQIDRMWMHYWMGDAEAMIEIVERHGVDIAEHASQQQLGKYYQARTALGFRHERYRLSPQTRQFAEAALTAVQRAGDTGELAFTHFMLGFSALWMDEFEVAAEQFHHAAQWAERTGDVTVLSRVLTYEAILRRRLRDVNGVRSCIERVLPVATQGQMFEYIGTAHANLAWIALQDEELERAEEAARRALDTWRGLPIVYAFRWTALLVLLDLAVRRSNLQEAHDLVTTMLHPTQQLLSREVMDALAAAAASTPDGPTEFVPLLEDVLAKTKRHRYL